MCSWITETYHFLKVLQNKSSEPSSFVEGFYCVTFTGSVEFALTDINVTLNSGCLPNLDNKTLQAVDVHLEKKRFIIESIKHQKICPSQVPKVQEVFFKCLILSDQQSKCSYSICRQTKKTNNNSSHLRSWNHFNIEMTAG